jgi:thymidylate synthase (FAD)
MWLIKEGATAQEAREVLVNSTATELVMTGFESDWQAFFALRCDKSAHPQAIEMANKIKEIF